MKRFLNRVKAMLLKAVLYTVLFTVVLSLFVLGCMVTIVDTIKAYVRGATSWIADKYNGVIAKFKTEVKVESTTDVAETK